MGIDWKDITKDIVLKWSELSTDLLSIKKRESSLRKKIADVVLNGKKKGIKHEILENLKVSATGKINLTIDKEGLRAIWSDLSKEERACINFDPSIVVSKYNKISDESPLKSVITAKPGHPGLKIAEIPG